VGPAFGPDGGLYAGANNPPASRDAGTAGAFLDAFASAGAGYRYVADARPDGVLGYGGATGAFTDPLAPDPGAAGCAAGAGVSIG
jgi:hypothetical protein